MQRQLKEPVFLLVQTDRKPRPQGPYNQEQVQRGERIQRNEHVKSVSPVAQDKINPQEPEKRRPFRTRGQDDDVRDIFLRRPIRRISFTVVTTKRYASYWAAQKNVSNVIVLPSRSEGPAFLRLLRINLVLRDWRDTFDVLISLDPFASLDLFLVVRTLRPRFSIGLNKQEYRLFELSLHDSSFDWTRRHMAGNIRDILFFLGIDGNAILTPNVELSAAGAAEAERIAGG